MRKFITREAIERCRRPWGYKRLKKQEFSLVLNNRQEKGEKQDVFVRSEKRIFLKGDYLFWS